MLHSSFSLVVMFNHPPGNDHISQIPSHSFESMFFLYFHGGIWARSLEGNVIHASGATAMPGFDDGAGEHQSSPQAFLGHHYLSVGC